MPNGRCYVHGGKTPYGAASPHYKTGRYSKYVPGNLAEIYDERRADPDLLSLHDNVALLDVRIIELLNDMDRGAAGQLWSSLLDEWARLITAIQSNNQKQQSKSINRLNRIINDGAAVAAAWDEIARLTETRRRAVESEQRVITTRETMVTVENVLMYLAIQIEATKDAVKQYVSDVETRERIINAASEANRRLLGASVDR